MPNASGQESRTPSVASSTEKDGDYHNGDSDADGNEPTANENVADSVPVEDPEKGSPAGHSPHVIKDGGMTAWSTVLGAYVE
jgi:hypothetical protein